MAWLQKRLDAVCETDDVAVETFQFAVANTNNIHRANFHGFLAHFVEKWNDSLFVWQGNVQPSEFGIVAKNIRKHCNIRNLEVEILRINTFASKFFSKETSAEAVPQGITNDAVFRHFVARYIVLIPKVKRRHCTSVKPALRRMPSICSGCGKASMEAGRYVYALSSWLMRRPSNGITT